jgi:hypothetical protein
MKPGNRSVAKKQPPLAGRLRRLHAARQRDKRASEKRIVAAHKRPRRKS